MSHFLQIRVFVLLVTMLSSVQVMGATDCSSLQIIYHELSGTKLFKRSTTARLCQTPSSFLVTESCAGNWSHCQSRYLSQLRKIKWQYSPRMNPSHAICLNLAGEPFMGSSQFDGKEKVLDLCKTKDDWIEMSLLMKWYRDRQLD